MNIHRLVVVVEQAVESDGDAEDVGLVLQSRRVDADLAPRDHGGDLPAVIAYASTNPDLIAEIARLHDHYVRYPLANPDSWEVTHIGTVEGTSVRVWGYADCEWASVLVADNGDGTVACELVGLV